MALSHPGELDYSLMLSYTAGATLFIMTVVVGLIVWIAAAACGKLHCALSRARCQRAAAASRGWHGRLWAVLRTMERLPAAQSEVRGRGADTSLGQRCGLCGVLPPQAANRAPGWKLSRLPFYRDTLCVCVALSVLLGISANEHVYLGEALAFVCMYVFYVGLVVVLRCCT